MNTSVSASINVRNVSQKEYELFLKKFIPYEKIKDKFLKALEPLFESNLPEDFFNQEFILFNESKKDLSIKKQRINVTQLTVDERRKLGDLTTFFNISAAKLIHLTILLYSHNNEEILNKLKKTAKKVENIEIKEVKSKLQSEYECKTDIKLKDLAKRVSSLEKQMKDLLIQKQETNEKDISLIDSEDNFLTIEEFVMPEPVAKEVNSKKVKPELFSLKEFEAIFYLKSALERGVTIEKAEKMTAEEYKRHNISKARIQNIRKRVIEIIEIMTERQEVYIRRNNIKR